MKVRGREDKEEKSKKREWRGTTRKFENKE